MAGDTLARGARRATFFPKAQVTQEKWDKIWADETPSQEPAQETDVKASTDVEQSE